MKSKLILLLSFWGVSSAFAQQGSYISPFVMYQMTSLPNYHDQSIANNSDKLKFENTFLPAFGVNYIFNSNNFFGF